MHRMQSVVGHRLLSILEGDRGAAGWLYDTFAPRLFRRLRQRYAYPGGPDGEDLLQDSYVFFFQNDCRVLRRFLERVPPAEQTEGRLETYLWDLACGVATNHRRSAALRNVVSLPQADWLPEDPSAERQAISRDTLSQIEECLKMGRERIFLYYTLRYRDGLKPEEISQACGWSRKATYKMKQVLDKAVEECARLAQVDLP
ncbi:MAG: sigma-70 family RNA polymerase sigma factor [Deltaproteobacteria bacterium]|nr:sigma-70 family RNA polymerase sigma factor [Deltaproteobacteria bacterium]